MSKRLIAKWSKRFPKHQALEGSFSYGLPQRRNEWTYAGSPEKQKQGKWGSLHEDIINLILEEAYFNANLRPNLDHFTKYGFTLFYGARLTPRQVCADIPSMASSSTSATLS